MLDRIARELELLRRRFPALEYVEIGHWIRIPDYPLPAGWNRAVTDVSFVIPVGYPGAPPYGIYVPVGLVYGSSRPNNYTEPAGGISPPFPGQWGVFSWAPGDGEWRPTADLGTSSNLLHWALGFADRFRQGV